MTIWNKIKQNPKIGLVLLAYVAFIALGMPDGLLGVGWPSIREGFGVPLDAAGMLLTASVIGYMTSSFLSGPLVARVGIGRVLVGSCALTGLALISYTLVPQWWMMAALGVFAGLGAGAIDAGLNTYAAAHFSEGLMQWMHASYGIGVTLGPIIMTYAITQLSMWRFGYRVVGGFQLALAACFVLTLPMWSRKNGKPAGEEPKRLTDYKTPMLQTLRHGQVWLSALVFFLYVGAEISLGTWTYSLLTTSRGIDPAAAGLWAGSYWGTFTIGRVLAGLVSRRIKANTLVMGGITGALLGAALLLWNPFPLANLIAVALIGFCIAPVFPGMTSATSQRVGEQDAANTIGLQMTAAGLSGAVLPGLVGVLSRQISLEVVPVCMLVVFGILFVAYGATIKLKKA